MRKLIMWNITTLDGYFEGEKNWDLSFHNTVWGPELEKLSLEQLRSADYLVFGRVTYEMMAGFWPTPMAIESMPEVAKGMNESEKIVFSTTLESTGWENTTLIKTDLVEAVRKLKAIPGKVMTILGSGSIQLAEQTVGDRGDAPRDCPRR